MLRLQVELPRRIHDYNISLDAFFRKNELETIFKKLVERVTNKKWLGVFIFCFLISFLLNIFFIFFELFLG